MRCAYFPLRPRRSLEKSTSGNARRDSRLGSADLFPFFMHPPFTSRRTSRTDDAHSVPASALRKDDEEQIRLQRHTDQDETIVMDRAFVGNGQVVQERVAASSNVTPCLRTLVRAFAASHSKSPYRTVGTGRS